MKKFTFALTMAVRWSKNESQAGRMWLAGILVYLRTKVFETGLFFSDLGLRNGPKRKIHRISVWWIRKLFCGGNEVRSVFFSHSSFTRALWEMLMDSTPICGCQRTSVYIRLKTSLAECLAVCSTAGSVMSSNTGMDNIKNYKKLRRSYREQHLQAYHKF